MLFRTIALGSFFVAFSLACGDDDGGSTNPTDGGGDATMMDGSTDADITSDGAVPDASPMADAMVDGSVTIDVDQVVSRTIESFCTFVSECPADLGGGALLAGLDCERAVSQILPTGELKDAVAKVKAGELDFDAQAFARCLERIAEQCVPIEGAVCPEAFEGDVAADGDCLSNYDCAGEAYCSFTGECPGTCVAKVQPGGNCSEDRECAAAGKDWGECDQENDRCRSVEIVSLGKQGDDCGVASALGNNLGLALCEKGLVCDSDDTQKCVTPPTAGESCENLDVCAPGSQCVDGTCISINFVGSVGTGCNAFTAPCDPQAGLTCEDGFCVAASDGANGSTCQLSPLGQLYCQAGLVCRQGPGANPPQCLPPGDEDAPCSSATQCASGSCEDGGCTAAYCGGADPNGAPF